MSKKQFLSIAMCTYNGAKYLQEQLDSIANQTRLPDEIVICDDGSTDATVEILEKFKRHAPFSVRIYKNKTNLGPTKNFEKAISLCNGDIIALSDQDDVWMPQKLEKLEKKLNAHSLAGYVFSDALVVDENLHSLGYTMWNKLLFTTSQCKLFWQGEQLGVLLKRNVVTGATMAFRSELRDIILSIPIQWIHDAWIALLLSAVGERGILVDEPLIKYRQHPKQVIGGSKITLSAKYRMACNTSRKGYIEEVKKLNQLYERLDEKNNLGGENKKIIYSKIYHLKNRGELYSYNITTLKKIKIMSSEFVLGRYYKFSNGLSSLIKDLFLSKKLKE